MRHSRLYNGNFLNTHDHYDDDDTFTRSVIFKGCHTVFYCCSNGSGSIVVSPFTQRAPTFSPPYVWQHWRKSGWVARCCGWVAQYVSFPHAMSPSKLSSSYYYSTPAEILSGLGGPLSSIKTGVPCPPWVCDLGRPYWNTTITSISHTVELYYNLWCGSPHVCLLSIFLPYLYCVGVPITSIS